MTAKNPKIGNYMDDEEKKLIEAIEAGAYDSGKNLLSEEIIEDLKASATHTLNPERTKVTIRLTNADLLKLKAKAMKEGMPYQTLIGSILHKAVS